MINLNEQIDKLETQLGEKQASLQEIIQQGRTTQDNDEKQNLMDSLHQILDDLDVVREKLKGLYVERHLQAAGVDTNKGFRFPKFW